MTRIRGKDVHRNRLKRMKAQYMKDPVVAALVKIGEAVRADAQASIRANGSPSPNHIVSKPGDPPNADTNNLDLAIDVRTNKARTAIEVKASAEYSAALEFGTSRIQARPFMRPALQRNRGRAVTGVAQAVSKEIRVYKNSTKSIDAAAKFIEGGE